MSPNEKIVTCTGVEVERDGDQFVFKPGAKSVWRGASLNVAVDENGQLAGGCKAMRPDGKCPYVDYDKAIHAIRQAAKRIGVNLEEGFVVSDEEGREMNGLVFERPTPPCDPNYRMRGHAMRTEVMSNGADCPRRPAPVQEGDPRPSDVYQITDPALLAGIAELLGKKE